MIEVADEKALAALLAVASGIYGADRFHLARREVIARVRGIVVARPGVTPTELGEIAGQCGVPLSVLVRVGAGEPAAAPVRETTTEWSRRTRLSQGG